MTDDGNQLTIHPTLRWIALAALLFAFLVAIELMSGSFKAFGKESADAVFDGLTNPFAGLAAGVLATVLVQSSSVTTSMVVALVGSGSLPVANAVPIIMGANIGTTVTNTLVSIGYVGSDAAFRRAFAGATVHDFFNLFTVSLALPLELATGFLRRGAEFLSGAWQGLGIGGEFHSPIKTSVKWATKGVIGLLENQMGLTGKWLAAVMLLTSLTLIVLTLSGITRNMKVLIADRLEVWLNRVLTKSGLLGLMVGVLMTVAVQSSSITTSLLVPMFGAGVLSLEAGFPIMIGANIGTTVTSLLAATVTGPAGLTIALVHLLFNLFGTLAFFPFQWTRRLPIRCAEKLAELASENKIWVIAYVAVVFLVIPVTGLMIWRS